jgi:hypothetical protein
VVNMYFLAFHKLYEGQVVGGELDVMELMG